MGKADSTSTEVMIVALGRSPGSLQRSSNALEDLVLARLYAQN